MNADEFMTDLKARADAALAVMNAEQWLADLEAKADAAQANWDKKYNEDSPEALSQLEATINHMNAANPAAVKRLVAMVRRLALSAGDRGCPTPLSECPNGYPCDECFILKAYQQTEPKP